MVKKAGDDEIDAILNNEEFDTEAIAKQVLEGTGDPGKDDPDKKKNPDDPDPGKINQDNKKQKTDNVPDLEKVRADILNETFGDQFKSWEEVKKANIPASIQELETLRRKNQDLETQLGAKPKHHFANDDIAKLNEFVRETGIRDVGVFNRINSLDVANMKDIDALILGHIIDNPRLAGKDPQEVREYFEMKYNVDPSLIDPKLVEDGKLTAEELVANKRKYNYGLMEMESDAQKAKDKILDLKGKIKMPEIPKDDPDPNKAKWTPEVEKTHKEAWNTVGTAMIGKFEKIPISIAGKDGAAEVIANFALPEKARTDILAKALKYVVDNRVEVNEENVKAIASSMYNDIWITHRADILHAVFERARTMTEEESLKFYHNPSHKNNDNPDRKKPEFATEEEIQRQAYELESRG